MGWQDRNYSRSRSEDSGDFLRRLFFGDFTLGHVFGIRVRIHSMLIFLIAFRLLLPGPMGFQTALISSAILFGVVLLHEFGHCFGARLVGGRGDDVLMWPFGGLAFIDTPRRPWPSFVGTVCGPLTNVLICVVCAGAIRLLSGIWVAGNPLAPFLMSVSSDLSGVSSQATYYLWWIYSTSLSLLLFNLLPIFPMDGGRMLQEILWPKLGYYRSMNIACITGMAGAVIFGIPALFSGNFFLAILAYMGFSTCYQMKMNLRALADQAYEEERAFSGRYNVPMETPKRAAPWARVQFGSKIPKRPRDDRFTVRDLNPLEWLARRKRRKQFERLMRDD